MLNQKLAHNIETFMYKLYTFFSINKLFFCLYKIVTHFFFSFIIKDIKESHLEDEQFSVRRLPLFFNRCQKKRKLVCSFSSNLESVKSLFICLMDLTIIIEKNLVLVTPNLKLSFIIVYAI